MATNADLGRPATTAELREAAPLPPLPVTTCASCGSTRGRAMSTSTRPKSCAPTWTTATASRAIPSWEGSSAARGWGTCTRTTASGPTAACARRRPLRRSRRSSMANRLGSATSGWRGTWRRRTGSSETGTTRRVATQRARMPGRPTRAPLRAAMFPCTMATRHLAARWWATPRLTTLAAPWRWTRSVPSCSWERTRTSGATPILATATLGLARPLNWTLATRGATTGTGTRRSGRTVATASLTHPVTPTRSMG